MYDYQSGPNAAFGLFPILLMFGVYLYFAYCQYRTAQKIGLYDCAWWAWIPIMNTFLLFRMANRPNWWFWLMFVPIANIVCIAILWKETAINAKVPYWWGYLMLVPFVNVVAIGVMAFSALPERTTPTQYEPQPREPEQVG